MALVCYDEQETQPMLSDKARIPLQIPNDTHLPHEYMKSCNENQLSVVNFVAHHINQIRPNNLVYTYNRSTHKGSLHAANIGDEPRKRPVVTSQETVRLSDMMDLVTRSVEFVSGDEVKSDIPRTWKIVGADRVALCFDFSYVGWEPDRFSIRFFDIGILYKCTIGKVMIVPLLSMTHTFQCPHDEGGMGTVEFQFPLIYPPEDIGQTREEANETRAFKSISHRPKHPYARSMSIAQIKSTM